MIQWRSSWHFAARPLQALRRGLRKSTLPVQHLHGTMLRPNMEADRKQSNLRRRRRCRAQVIHFHLSLHYRCSVLVRSVRHRRQVCRVSMVVLLFLRLLRSMHIWRTRRCLDLHHPHQDHRSPPWHLDSWPSHQHRLRHLLLRRL